MSQGDLVLEIESYIDTHRCTFVSHKTQTETHTRTSVSHLYDSGKMIGSPTVSPVKVVRCREPHEWKELTRRSSDGVVMPADQAYIDTILDGIVPDSNEWSTLLKMDSVTDRIDTVGSEAGKQFVYRHVLLYKGEPIWKLETRSCYEPSVTWGQSSNCVLTNGRLRVNLLHKGRRASGEGWHTHEKRVYSLSKLLSESGRLRQQQMEEDLLR